ncbi:MAG: ATP-dependent DNA helicase RecG [Flavobacteriales bacterium]|nr:ATP-dependent DNA helicase RecG [Flavobacteriales bacterium]
MITSFLNTPIEFLKGVGPKRADLLKKEIGIFVYNDLLNYFPFRYIDRSIVHLVKNTLHLTDQNVQLRGSITQINKIGQGRKQRLVAQFRDHTGSIELVWFKGIKWVEPSLKLNEELIIFGKVSNFGSKRNIVHPEVEKVVSGKQLAVNLQPVYHSTEILTRRGLNAKGIEKLTKTLILQLSNQVHEVLSETIRSQYYLQERELAYKQIHFPTSTDALKKAKHRLKFEELFFLQLQLIRQNLVTKKATEGFIFDKIGTYFNTFFSTHLPFELTGAQKRVIKEIRKDLGSGLHMNRLLQGDVGSGKTLVALMSMLIALDNGFQACMMAPTEILAIQHFEGVSEFLAPMGVEVALLTGSTKAAERRKIHADLEKGTLSILIGTHALLEDKVKFKNLGLSVIDEQHRFGVAQRAKLWRKNKRPPHILVMTATPIPRTLAMTFYGDLDVSVIDELPPGRKAIKTVHYFDSKRLSLFQFIEDEIKKGRQVYIVYPLIEESEKFDYKDLMDGYESIKRRFPLPQYNISIVHGKMKPADKEYEMQQFAQGKTQIMVATTVIEVGVNVPNASVMVIESAEKFGLSALHQLRGRVGRGAEQSFCILMTSYKLSENAKKRIETMVQTNDGFEIAEVDLKMRGPGDIMGTQQSGILDLKIADIAKDGQILQQAKDAAAQLLKQDPNLSHKQNYYTRITLINRMKERPNWSKIS